MKGGRRDWWFLLTVALIVVTCVVVVFSGRFLKATADGRFDITHHEEGVDTWEQTGEHVCTEHPNGILAGWTLTVHKEKAWMFGSWSGNFCSNANRVWNVYWGEQPGGVTSTLWTLDNTKATDGQTSHGWESHFYTAHQECHPTMMVTIRPGAIIIPSEGENCV